MMADKPFQLHIRHGKSILSNFHLGACKVRDENNTRWITMSPYNTMARNPDFDETKPQSEENPLWLKIGGPDVN